jgi:hypothetical protein
MKKLIQRAIAQSKLFWASLPHQVQAGAVVFATAAGTTLGKEVQALIFGTAHFTRSSLQHDIGAACVAGILAARAFYMFPNRDSQPLLPIVSSTTPTTTEPPSLAEKPTAEKRSQP